MPNDSYWKQEQILGNNKRSGVGLRKRRFEMGEGWRNIQNWKCLKWFTLPKTNTDTQNDGLDMVTPFKYAHF